MRMTHPGRGTWVLVVYVVGILVVLAVMGFIAYGIYDGSQF